MAQQALGMIETKGYAAIVEAADAMLKAADVTAGQYHEIGARHRVGVRARRRRRRQGRRRRRRRRGAARRRGRRRDRDPEP